MSQNRGKSGYVRISWDEALEIIVSEIKRVIDKYGPYAIFSQADGHGEPKMVHCPHGQSSRASPPSGGLYPADQKPGQLGGVVLGRQTRLGDGAGGYHDPDQPGVLISPSIPSFSSTGGATRKPPSGAGRGR